MQLAGQVRHAKGEEREKLKTQLTEIVNKHFTIRQQRRELQVKRMDDELKRLQGAINQRNEARASIIKNRMSELIGDPQDLDF